MPLILVIDDEHSVRALIRDVLRSEGYDVEEAPDGAEGLRRFDEARPDLVLTDLTLPGTDGVRVLGEIQRRNPAIPLIAMSGYAGAANGMAKAALSAGAREVLGKPFTLSVVLEAIARALAPDMQAAA